MFCRGSGIWRVAGSLYKFGLRYYDPSDGRWTQTDPSGQEQGYLFAGDDPVNQSDPAGTSSGYYRVPDRFLRSLARRFGYRRFENLKEQIAEGGSKIELYFKHGEERRQFYTRPRQGKEEPDMYQPTGSFEDDEFIIE